jgi:hypothetical protein
MQFIATIIRKTYTCLQNLGVMIINCKISTDVELPLMCSVQIDENIPMKG